MLVLDNEGNIFDDRRRVERRKEKVKVDKERRCSKERRDIKDKNKK